MKKRKRNQIVELIKQISKEHVEFAPCFEVMFSSFQRVDRLSAWSVLISGGFGCRSIFKRTFVCKSNVRINMLWFMVVGMVECEGKAIGGSWEVRDSLEMKLKSWNELTSTVIRRFLESTKVQTLIFSPVHLPAYLSNSPYDFPLFHHPQPSSILV